MSTPLINSNVYTLPALYLIVYQNSISEKKILWRSLSRETTVGVISHRFMCEFDCEYVLDSYSDLWRV